MTLYCRTADRAEAEALLVPLGLSLSDEDGNALSYAQTGDMIADVIGPFITAPAVLDESGGVVTEAVVDTRFHFNVYNPTPEAASALSAATIPTPANPLRVLA